jgi:hypothetical protein
MPLHCAGSSSQQALSDEENEPEDANYVAHIRPGLFTTKSQHKRASKKREKLARRAAWARSGSSGGQQPQPRSVKDEEPQYFMVQTDLSYGGFERHTTGAALQNCARTMLKLPLMRAACTHYT